MEIHTMRQFLKPFMMIALLIIAMFSLQGCQAIKSVFSGENDTTLRIAVYTAVDSMIKATPEYRERILELTADSKQFIAANPEAKAADIIGSVREEIKWEKLTPNQSVIAETLLIVIQEEIRERIEGRTISDTSRTRVIQIITWIEQAAMAAPPSTSQ
jgi:hypothetical protein